MKFISLILVTILFSFCSSNTEKTRERKRTDIEIVDTIGQFGSMYEKYHYMGFDTTESMMYYYFYGKDTNLLAIMEHVDLKRMKISDTLLYQPLNFMVFDSNEKIMPHKSNILRPIIKNGYLKTEFSWNYGFSYVVLLFKKESQKPVIGYNFKNSTDSVHLSKHISEREIENIDYGVIKYVGNSQSLIEEMKKTGKTSAWRYYFEIEDAYYQKERDITSTTNPE